MDDKLTLESAHEEIKTDDDAAKTQKEKRTGELSFKVSEKGAVSVYGLGRFPVTLYQEQWARLLAVADDLKEFIKHNSGRLKVKE